MGTCPPACLPPLNRLIVSRGSVVERLADQVGKCSDRAAGPARRRNGAGEGERDAEDGIGPQPGLVRRAIQRDQRAVQVGLRRQKIGPRRRCDLASHVGHGLRQPRPP